MLLLCALTRNEDVACATVFGAASRLASTRLFRDIMNRFGGRNVKNYGVNDLRRMFLEFFESKEHLAHKSFSLVPHNDNSLLIINSGMAPLKPYFTGQEIPPRRRMTTCQKCVRTGDIENVGKTCL